MMFSRIWVLNKTQLYCLLHPGPPIPENNVWNHIAALEALVEVLTWENLGLRLRVLEPSHPEINRENHEEEERGSHVNNHQRHGGGRQEDNFQGEDRQDNHHWERNHHEDPGGMGRLADLERRCARIEWKEGWNVRYSIKSVPYVTYIVVINSDYKISQ